MSVIQRKVVKSRIDFVAGLINDGAIQGHSVCDLGSRDEVLKHMISKDIKYLGVDIYPVKDNTIFSDIQKRIETEEQFDIVTAIDVLEHTDNIEKAISEMLRICSGTFVINLPNEIFLLYRIRLFFGILSGKFLVNLNSKDRHRWFFTLENVKALIDQSELAKYDKTLIALYKKGGLVSFVCRIFGFLGFHSVGAHSFIILGNK